MGSRLTAASLLLFAVSALAAPNPPRWIELRSQHFLVLTDSNEKDARRIAVQFEGMRSVFHVLFPAITADNSQITILAFKDRKGLQALEPSAYLAKGQIVPAGLFLRTSDTSYILLRLDTGNGQEHPYATVYREYTQMLTSKAEWLPLWINEGLAEFYENADINGKVARVGQPSEDDVRSLSDDNDLYIRHQIPLPLTTVLAADHNSPYYRDEKKGSVFHAESWALTHFLIVSDHNDKTHLLDDYFANLIKGQDSVTAAQNAFGDLNKLQDRLAFYIKEHLDFYNPQYRFSYFDLPVNFTADESTFKIQTLSAADADSIRAGVLVYDDRKDEALALLNDTLRDDPKNALAHETMGLLKLHEGDPAAARKWYDQAVQLDSQSYLAQYYSAALAQREGDTSHPAAIESSLLASIRLNPGFAPAYDSLALFDSNDPDKLDQAQKMSSQAVTLDPSNINYRLDDAYVLMLRQEPDKALTVLKGAEGIAATPADLAKVRARREQIEQSQAAAAKFKSDSPEAPQTAPSHGQVAEATPETPRFPPGPPTGPQHIANGIVRNVNCYYPSVLSLDLESSGKTVTYYTNDYLKVDYYNLNFVPQGPLDPCKDIAGMKASIRYTELPANSSQLAAGQIVKISLTKVP